MNLNKTFFSLTLIFLGAVTVLAQEPKTNSPAESPEPVEVSAERTNEVASASDSSDRNEWLGRQPLVAIGKNADLPESDSALAELL